ncbi:MAG TPA: hypothetical protein VKY85_07535 [Candidatus Angelobacter sp.]|nr:hypothetical protein [Candidatus Angelobacter sp.]
MRTHPSTLLELLAALTRIELHFPPPHASARERRAALSALEQKCTLVTRFAETQLEASPQTDELGMTVLEMRAVAMGLRRAAKRAAKAKTARIDRMRGQYDTLGTSLRHVALLVDSELAGKVDAALCL